MKVKLLKTGEVLETTYFRALLMVEQGKASIVPEKPKTARTTRKAAEGKAGEA